MKKELFKQLIKEFHEKELPSLKRRNLSIPETKKIVSLIGSRRSGKTFYFYQLIQDFLKNFPKERLLYINFEDDRILPLDVKELDNILEAYYELYPENKNTELFLFFDEIQNVENWEIYLRRIYDKERVKIFVTGSSSKMFSKEIATSLRGRTLAFNLFPLDFKEFLRFNDILLEKNTIYSSERFKIKKLFERYLTFGGFPEVVLEENKLEYDILNNYFEIMIYRDIVERYSVRNINLLKMLSKFLLTNISLQFSVNSYYNTLKKDISVSKETILEYLSYLEEANLIFLLPLFSYSMKVQQANPKKVYCIDTGLRNAISFKFSKDEGRLVENLVFIELKMRNKEIYYWKNNNEVDFIIKNKDNSLEAINVSYTDDLDEREVKGLLEFKKKFRKIKKLVIITKNMEKKENGIKFIPLWKWLLC
ncbi:MAG: ATP-binding protein [Nanoarchaeota archaeon]|nr:ATP-binding protein [Nanoarchaeota archaeon]